MKLRSWIFFVGVPAALVANPLREGKFPLDYAPEKSLSVKIELVQNKAVARLPNGKTQQLSEHDGAEFAGEAVAVLVGDFNFDGADDIAILEGIGYGGVNLFYRVWLWQSQSKNFREFATPIGNPALNTTSRMLLSGQRSGPRWYQTLFTAKEGELVQYAEAAMMDNAHYWFVTFSDGTRAIADAQWFDGDLAKRPTPEVQFDEALCDKMLAMQPKDKSAEPSKVKGKQKKLPRKGKKRRAMLVDFRGANENAEVLLRFADSQKTRWVNASCVFP